MGAPIILAGTLGWGNDGCNSLCSLDVYGPGGRWASPTSDDEDRRIPNSGGRNGRGGHQIADALADEGATEGARLVVIALPRRTSDNDRDDVIARIDAMFHEEP